MNKKFEKKEEVERAPFGEEIELRISVKCLEKRKNFSLQKYGIRPSPTKPANSDP